MGVILVDEGLSACPRCTPYVTIPRDTGWGWCGTWEPAGPQNDSLTLIKYLFPRMKSHAVGGPAIRGGYRCSLSIAPSHVALPSLLMLCFLQSISSGWWKRGANI